MRACGVRGSGGPIEVLEVPDPRAPEPGEVVLSVRAAGMGRWDGLLHTGGWDLGLRPPAALGVEGAGTVTAVGPDITEVAVGDLVLTHAAPLPGGSGLWAEQALVPAATVAACPAALDPVLAGGLPVAALTARQALDRLGVVAGSRLLITGGSGPTGAVALQLAVRTGAAVVVTAAARQGDRLRELGAEQVVDSHAPDWPARVDRRFDAVLVAAPGTAVGAMTLLQDGARLCSIVSDAPPGERGIDSADLYVQPDAAQLGQLALEAAEGRLTLEVRAVPLREAPPVATDVTTGRAGGIKYVLTPG